MKITEKQRFQLKKFIKELENYRGRHTELVTVYVPAGYDLNKIVSHISQEQGTASNIKSSQTRKNVIDALERMLQHLKLFPKTPPHGLAAFSGNVAEREGQSDVQVWSIEPPVPLNTRIYRCDKEFQLDLLRDMCEDKDVYGLVVMDRREGDIAILKGKTIVPLTKTKSNVPGKTRAGGQSAQRFERLREGAAKDFYKKIAEMMKEQFLEMEGLKGIIVGGPGPTKHDLIEGGYITGDVKKKIIAIKDLSYTGDFGLQELIDKSEDVLASEAVAEEKQLMGKFFNLLAKQPDLVTYGLDDIRKKLEAGAVETVLVSEEADDDVIEELEKTSDQFGTDVQLISTETREGVQLRDMGKIAAILRFAM